MSDSDYTTREGNIEIPESSSDTGHLDNNGGNKVVEEISKRKSFDCNKRMSGTDSCEGSEADGELKESPKRVKIEPGGSPTEQCAPTENSADDDIPSSSVQIRIKEEPVEANAALNEINTGVSQSVKIEPLDEEPTAPYPVSNGSLNTCEAEVKVEPQTQNIDDQPSGSGVMNPRNIVPAVKVETSDASSTTSRMSCRFGVRCYRRNPMHRQEEAHPGDSDYKRPSFPPPPKGTPDCPYGDSCYRRNPVHFQQYSHPPDN